MFISTTIFIVVLASHLHLALSYKWDVIVYDSTPSGITAAISAARLGKKVALLSPTHHLGGMCSGGLGQSDVGGIPYQIIGGLAREFFLRNAEHYIPTEHHPNAPWTLEPHVAEQVFRTMLEESHVHVIESSGHVIETTFDSQGFLTSLTTQWNEYHGKLFIDASYEGDLLAKANISTTIGRESNMTYGERYAGNLAKNDFHEFKSPVNTYDNATGTHLPYLLTSDHPGEVGDADRKIQAYNFRLCVTKDPGNQVPFERPTQYDESRWELFRRYIRSLADPVHELLVPSRLTTPLPNGKFDCNNAGPISTDFVGGSWSYPEATYTEREKIWENHKQYMLELFWFLRHDESVPAATRQNMKQWGLCADEFQATNHWPPQLYVREARRMVGDRVFTQVDIEQQDNDIGIESIGLGSYSYDSHTAQRFPCSNCSFLNTTSPESYAWNEGDLERSPGPYQIPAWVVYPKKEQAKNVLSSVCISASHVAFNTLRMEPQFMIIGQAAGIIAALAEPGRPVQDTDLCQLRKHLIETKQLVNRVNSSQFSHWSLDSMCPTLSPDAG